jgi:hypothetical protein
MTTNPINFIKNLIFENLNYRYELNPVSIRDYSIYDENISNIKNFASQIDKISQFEDPALKPVFSKGINRLLELINLITNNDLWYLQTDNFKLFIIAQFIVLNQVFGDGNHRTAIHVLKAYSTYTNEEIDYIMKFTERIHDYRADLHYVKLWKLCGELLYPDTHKLFCNESISLLLKK